MDKDIKEIAKEYLGIEVLETRNSDSLDFYSLSVGCIKAALEEAFQRGHNAGGTETLLKERG